MQSLSRCIWVLFFPIFLFGTSLTGTIAVSTSEAKAGCGKIKLACPGGNKIKRKTRAGTGAHRCVTKGSIRKAVEKKCRTPFGVPKNDLKWWYEKASQAKACSGPIGDAMSGTKWFPVFHEACVMHDLCYTYTTRKKRCENKFFRNMKAL